MATIDRFINITLTRQTQTVPEEGFGIRLEDNIVVQEYGAPFNLMGNIPIEADEIEDIMNS